MTIDRKKLVELLVEKTGLGEKQVEEQLSELITRIQKAAEEGKSFEIEGFGTFSIKDDELHFEPADQLETEVNHKYAGMEPIELIGAYKEKETDADAEEPEADAEQEEDALESQAEKKKEDIWGFDTEAAEESSPDKEVQEEIVEEPAGQEQTPEVPKEKPEETTQDEEKELPKAPVGEKDEEEPEHEEAEEEPALEHEQENEEEPVEQKPAEKKASKWAPADELKTKPWKKPEKKKQDPIGTIMVTVVIVIAVGVGGWLVYDLGLLDGIFGSSENGGQQVASTTQRPRLTQPEPEAVDEKPEQSQSGQQEAQQPPQDQQAATSEPEAQKEVAESTGQEQASAGEPLYGLMGEANPDANDGYTIVVYSLTNRSKARDLHNQLRDEGYRTVLMDATVGGNEFWRVGLGQFETVRDAQQAAGDLRPPFSNNFFIKRIQ